MIKGRWHIAVAAIIVVIFLMIAGVFTFQNIINHELNQNKRIYDLEGRIGLIETKAKLSEEFSDSAGKFNGGGTTI